MSDAAKFPITDAVLEALAITRRGVDELLPEAEWTRKLARSAATGVPLSDPAFIWCAGTTELLIGLFLAFGIFPRVIIVAAWGIINLTLTIFSWVELVGHLPLYGIMAVLLIWDPSDKTNALWSRGVLGREP